MSMIKASSLALSCALLIAGATSTLVLLPFTLNEIFIAELPLGEE